MQLQYLIPLWVSIPVLLPMLVLCGILLVARPRQRVAWMRRLLMVVLIAVVALRPVTPIEGEQTERMNANIFFVVDRTGSMNAEDYAGGETRLDGVKADMRQIMERTEGSRYSIIGFDSAAAEQLPLTTDAGAVEAWIDTADVETTSYSQGSNVDRPLPQLLTALSETKRDDPESSRLVYVFSDGENTDGQESQPFGAVAPLIDGGAVLGYGTAEGGPMTITGGENDGEYMMDGSEQAVSTLDEEQLKTMADAMGVPYLHRTDPEEPIEGTMEDVTLTPIPIDTSSRVPSFEDWYWIASIPLAMLFIWELGAMTYRLPRRIDRGDVAPIEER